MLATKLLALFLCANQTTASQVTVNIQPISENRIFLTASDGESSLYGFSVDRDVFDVNWRSSEIHVNYNSVYCGALHLDIGGVKMKEKLDNGNYAYGVLIRGVMSPREFTLTSDGKSHTYRGRSRYLDISSSISGLKKLIEVQPENMAGSNSYSIGFRAGGSSSGFSGSISASTTVTQNALEIKNTSNIVDGTVQVKYQYNRHIWPWEWKRTEYCWYDSVQRCSFFFSSPNPVSYLSVNVKPTFAIDDGKVGMWNLEMGYELTGNSYVSAYFPG
jgi:hypothetical protein